MIVAAGRNHARRSLDRSSPAGPFSGTAAPIHRRIGDGGRGAFAFPSSQNSGKYFAGKYHLKFENSVNYSYISYEYIYFRAKMSRRRHLPSPEKMSGKNIFWANIMENSGTFRADIV